MHTCAPSANNSGGRRKQKPRGAFTRRPSASTTPLPARPGHSLFSFPLKSPPPAWLWEAQFMLAALGILFLAGTEQGSQRGGGPGSRTSRSLVSRRQRRAGTGSPRADRKSELRPPRATVGPARAGAVGGLQRDWSRGRGGGCTMMEPKISARPPMERWASLAHPCAMEQACPTPQRGATPCQAGTQHATGKLGG